MMAAGAPDVAEVRRQIVAIYQAHQPRKLPDVDALMAEWAGDEHVLLASIRKKWVPAELEPEPEPGPPEPEPGPGPEPGEPESAEREEDMAWVRTELKRAKAAAEAAEAAEVEAQASQAAAAAVSIQAAWRGQRARDDVRSTRRRKASAEGTRYVVSIPVDPVDGLGLGLATDVHGCPYVAQLHDLDPGVAGAAEEAGVILGSAVLAVSGVSVSGGTDVRAVKKLMAQSLRSGEPVQLELRAPPGSLVAADAGADGVEATTPAGGGVGAAIEETAVDVGEELLDDVQVTEADTTDMRQAESDSFEEEEDEYDESFEEEDEEDEEEEVVSVADVEAVPTQADVPAASGGGAPDGSAELLAAQRAELEQLRESNRAAEEQRLEVARLSSTLHEVMQRLATSESSAGEDEAQVQNELAALRQSVTQLTAEAAEEEHVGSQQSAPLWGAPAPAPAPARPLRARSAQRARSAERRPRSADRATREKPSGRSKKAWYDSRPSHQQMSRRVLIRSALLCAPTPGHVPLGRTRVQSPKLGGLYSLVATKHPLTRLALVAGRTRRSTVTIPNAGIDCTRKERPRRSVRRRRTTQCAGASPAATTRKRRTKAPTARTPRSSLRPIRALARSRCTARTLGAPPRQAHGGGRLRASALPALAARGDEAPNFTTQSRHWRVLRRRLTPRCRHHCGSRWASCRARRLRTCRHR